MGYPHEALMDLTDRLIRRDEAPAVPYRWPALAFAGGAVVGLVAVLALSAVWIETDPPDPAGRTLGRLVVTVANRPLVVRESMDFHGLEMRLSGFSWGLIAAGMVGGGAAGLVGVGAARRAFFATIGPDGRV